ncbi:MAG: InlB B-repeat-containing protein [Firmicutes bacterium]|nr:InlB B-repeat-containing protein [Bacillota bacterium]
MSAFLPTDNQVNVDFYGNKPSGSSQIHFLVQNSDGSYTEKDTITAGGGNFYISDKYIGYHAVQYRPDNDNWRSVGNKNSQGYYNNGDPVSYSNNLYIRFDRTDYTLTFYTNNGSNQLADYTVPYDQSLQQYADQNPGQRRGYYFLGWYEDPGCTEEFDFSQNMPDNNVAVYGKWKMRRIRVVIEPGANNVYMGSQATAFRLDYDERIDGGLLETATRAGYILDGWYTDPDFTNRFLFSDPVNDETSDVAWDYQTSPRWAAERAVYGDDAERYENVRGILHLYAKWIPDPNSRGINVEYDPGDAAIYDSVGTLLTAVPIDSLMYDFDGTSIAREAPSNYSDLYTFKYWEATTEAGQTVHFYPGDPVDLSVLTATETVTDEITGEVLRKTVTLRAVYDLTGDPNRQTTITYDGDAFTENLYNGGTRQVQGRAADGTERKTVTLDKEVNQTIELPSAEDFYLDGYELVGWSFTEGTYEAQVAAATDDAPNFRPGQQVAADNLIISDLNDEGNTLYAMWQPKKYSITVKQIVEDGVPQNTFVYKYKSGPELALPADSVTQSLAGNSSFTLDDFGYYDLTGHVIHIEPPVIPADASYDVRVNAIVTKDDGTTEVLPLTELGNYPVLGDVAITYTYSQKVLLKMQKRDTTDHSRVLTGAKFDITPVEFNPQTNRWEDAGDKITITVNSETFERWLQEGTYRITETEAPADHALIGTDLYLSIDKENAWRLFNSSGGTVTATTAELNTAGDTLIVYDDPIHTVTLSKTVENEGADEFTFRVTVTDSGNTGLRNYVIGTWNDQELRTNNVGELNLLLKHRDVVQLKIPHGCKLKVAETETALYKAQYSWNNGTPVESYVFGEDPVAITEDGSLAFANLLKAVPVTLTKVGVDNTVIEPNEVPLAGAVFTVYTSATGTAETDIAKDIDGKQLKDLSSAADGVFFSGKLQVGTYYLEETTVPAGYYPPQGRFKLSVSTAADPKIEATWVTGNDSGTQGTVIGSLTDGYSVTVRNTSGVELPSTGGPGTAMLYILGGMLILLAGAGMIIRGKITGIP